MVSLSRHSYVAVAQNRDGGAVCGGHLHLSHDPVAFASDGATGFSAKGAPDECSWHAGSVRSTAHLAACIRGHRLSPELVLSRIHDCPRLALPAVYFPVRSEEHTSELQSLRHLVCR